MESPATTASPAWERPPPHAAHLLTKHYRMTPTLQSPTTVGSPLSPAPITWTDSTNVRQRRAPQSLDLPYESHIEGQGNFFFKKRFFAIIVGCLVLILLGIWMFMAGSQAMYAPLRSRDQAIEFINDDEPVEDAVPIRKGVDRHLENLDHDRNPGMTGQRSTQRVPAEKQGHYAENHVPDAHGDLVEQQEKASDHAMQAIDQRDQIQPLEQHSGADVIPQQPIDVIAHPEEPIQVIAQHPEVIEQHGEAIAIPHAETKLIDAIAQRAEEPIQVIAQHAEEPIQVIAHHAEEPIQVIAQHAEEPIQVIAQHAEEPIQVIPRHAEEPIQVIAQHADEPIQVIAQHAEEPIQVTQKLMQQTGFAEDAIHEQHGKERVEDVIVQHDQPIPVDGERGEEGDANYRFAPSARELSFVDPVQHDRGRGHIAEL